MKSINKKLSDLYINPNKYGFKYLSYLNKKKNIILVGFFVLLIGYQFVCIINIISQERKIKEEIINISSHISQSKKEYQALINKNKTLINQEHNVAYINKIIQKTVHKNGVKISKLDWNLEQDRSVDIRIINNSKAIFNVIYNLNKLPYLKFNSLMLSKSDKNKQLELNATLVLIEHKE